MACDNHGCLLCDMERLNCCIAASFRSNFIFSSIILLAGSIALLQYGYFKKKKEKASARNANYDINRFPPTEPLTRSKADRKNKDDRYKLDCYFSANLYVHKGYMSSFIPLQKILIKKISLFHPAKEECKNRSPFKCIPRLIVDNPREERRSRCTQNV